MLKTRLSGPAAASAAGPGGGDASRINVRPAVQRSLRLPLMLTQTAALSLGLALKAHAQVVCDDSTLIVSGTGGGTHASPWEPAQSLTIGRDGTCELQVIDGGQVNPPYNTGSVTIGQNPGSRGHVRVTGEDSALTLTGSGGISGQPGITVGNRGEGTLEISGGGQVTSYGVSLGSGDGGDGTLIITGGASRLQASRINIGSTQNSGGTGYMRIGGLSSVTASLDVNVGTGGTGRLVVTEGASLDIDSRNLNVGGGVSGTVDIHDGASVASSRGHINGGGLVTVDAGTWTLADMITLGSAQGQGVLRITSGGVVRMADSNLGKSVRIGAGATGEGLLEITGEGSLLSFDGILHVGYGPAGGELLINDGGRAESGNGWVGTGGGATSATSGRATVTGAGSTWVARDALEVGQNSSLAITAGGTAQSARGVIGSQLPGGQPEATVLVSGAGSAWDISNSLIVGREGTGTLTISEAGRVRVGATGNGTVTIARDSGSVGQLNLGAAPEDAPASATLEAGRIQFGSGQGVLVINHDSALELGADLAGTNGTLRHGAGLTVFTGDGREFGGSTLLSGGWLHVANRLGGNVFVSNGARLSGGQFGGTIQSDGGVLAPGQSPGLMEVLGDLYLDPASVLEFELGAPGGVAGVDSDLIRVGGDLALDGRLDVIDAGGFGAGVYRLFEYGGSLLSSGISIGAVPAGFTAGDLEVQTAIAKEVNLLVQQGAVPGSYAFWDGSQASGNGAVDGGNGAWTTAGNNWTLSDGSANGPYDPLAMLVFAGTPGEVAVDDVSIGAGLQFAVDGYRLTGGTIALDQAVTMRVGDGTAAGNAMTAVIASDLTGEGALLKNDLGTLELLGENSHRETRIHAGTVRVESDAALGDPLRAVWLEGLNDPATLALAPGFSSARELAVSGARNNLLVEGGTVTLSGGLSGHGTLTKRGAGLLHFTGDDRLFTGEVVLAEGGMRLDGLVAGALTTRAGTVLSGVGEVGSLEVAARLEPGTGIGTLSVIGQPVYQALLEAGDGSPPMLAAAASGELALLAGSTYVVQINDSGNVAGVNNDLVEAQTATLHDGARILVTPANGTDDGSTYAPGTTYTIIRTAASGGLAVLAPPAILDDFALLDFIGHTDGRDYFVTSQAVASFCRPGMTFNQCSTAGGVQSLGAGRAPYDAALLLANGDAPAAFDAMSGEVHASMQHVVDHTFSLFNRTLRQQGIAGAGAGVQALLDPTGGQAGARRHGAWASLLGGHGDIDSDGNAARIRWWNAGVAGGHEVVTRVGEQDMLLGVGLGYLRSHGSLRGRDATVEGHGYLLGTYGVLNQGPWRLAGALSYGANRATTERDIDFGAIDLTARTGYWVHSVGLSGELTHAHGLSPATRLSPVLTVDAGWSHRGSISEKHAGEFSLSSGARSWKRMEMGVGFELARTVQTRHGHLAVSGQALWEHSLAHVRRDTVNRFAGSDDFEIHGPGMAPNRVRLGAALTWSVSDRTSLRVRYGGLVSDDQSSHVASLGFAMKL